MTRRAERAEARARGLETENTALRSERAKAVLAAAKAERALQENRPTAANPPDGSPEAASNKISNAQKTLRAAERETAKQAIEQSIRRDYARQTEAFRRDHSAELESRSHAAAEHARQEMAVRIDALIGKLKDTSESLRAAKQERDAAVREIRVSLKKEFARDIDALRRKHTAELEAQSQSAAARAQQEVAQQIDTLTGRLKDADDSRRDAEREKDAAVAALRKSLDKDFSREIGALRQQHAAELTAQSQRAKQAFAKDLDAALSEAKAKWNKETDARLRDARRAAQQTLARARARWRLRSRAALWRIARIWRRREATRLVETEQKLRALHREALDARDRYWQGKLERFEQREPVDATRRPLWPEGLSRTGGIRRRAAAVLETLTQRIPLRPLEFRRPALGHAGFFAVLLIFLGVHFFPTAPVESGGPETVRRDATGTLHATPDARAERNAPVPREQIATSGDRKSASPGGSAATSDGRLTKDEVRRRLQQNIRKLRMKRSAQ